MKLHLILALSMCFIVSVATSQQLSPNFAKKNSSDPSTTDTSRKFVTFYGLTALNNANSDVSNSITATGRLAVEFTPANRLLIHMGANLINANPSKGTKKDSIDFNSLMFPETGNFGFLFNPSYQLHSWLGGDENRKHSLHVDFSYAYRKVKLDSFNVDFKVLSYTGAIKYKWDYKTRDSSFFGFTAMGYLNFFNIPDEDVNKFNLIMTDQLFKENNKNAEIKSIGIKVSVQYNSFVFFYDLRRNLGTKNLDDNNPFKGTKSNIGFATALRIKSL